VRIEGRAESVVVFGTRIFPQDPDGDGVPDGFQTDPFTDVLVQVNGTTTEEYHETMQLETVFVYDRPVPGAGRS
jgi:hypothetical protein